MCLAVLAWRAHPRYRLIVAANRDEYHARPTTPLAAWGDPPILAGRDLEAGGTWLGVDRGRRFGLVTNFREMAQRPAGSPSRGALIPDWLASTGSAENYLAGLAGRAGRFAGFNLLIADREGLFYASNRGADLARTLAPGVYGLANHALDAPWPKLLRVRRGFGRWLALPAYLQSLFALLADREPVPGDDLPQTGLSPEWERALSAPFVVHDRYGTRCSTVVAIGHDDSLEILERSFGEDGDPSGMASFRLPPGAWPPAEGSGNPPAPAQL